MKEKIKKTIAVLIGVILIALGTYTKSDIYYWLFVVYVIIVTYKIIKHLDERD